MFLLTVSHFFELFFLKKNISDEKILYDIENSILNLVQNRHMVTIKSVSLQGGVGENTHFDTSLNN